LNVVDLSSVSTYETYVDGLMARPFFALNGLAYLSRYTHRVAISNSRLLACDGAGVAFKYKDYRVDGHAR
jgi:hypothetical protein